MTFATQNVEEKRQVFAVGSFMAADSGLNALVTNSPKFRYPYHLYMGTLGRGEPPARIVSFGPGLHCLPMKRMNKVLTGEQYVANFLDEPIRIGTIFRMDDAQFVIAIQFDQAFPNVPLAPYVDKGSAGTLKFSEQKNVSITFGVSATTPEGESEVTMKFKRARSAAGAFAAARVEAVSYMPILPQLKKLWTDNGLVKYRREYFFVFQTVTAASGTFIYSEDRNNEVVLKHTAGATVSKLADLASGSFEYLSNTKRTLEIIRTTRHRPLFKAFRLRSDWEPEILG